MGITLEALAASLAFPLLVHIAQILPTSDCLWNLVNHCVSQTSEKAYFGRVAPNNAHGRVQKHNGFEEEGFVCVCSALHVVLLHSSCIMAPLGLMLKASQERFADTCLR